MIARRSHALLHVTATIAATYASGHAWAGVVVLANRGLDPVTLTATVDVGPPRQMTLAPGDARPLFAQAGVRVRSPQAGAGGDAMLEPDCAYAVALPAGQDTLRVGKIPLGEPGSRPWTAANAQAGPLPDSGVITVKILVDDNEYRPRGVWEGQLRQRMEKASAVLEEHCGIKLKVVAADTWNSDDLQNDFERSLDEFEGAVTPAPAQVAIGFSSQYPIAQGRVHMGGTRGPLHSHILLKERATNVLDVERLELLVHELGHFLGATHSAQVQSVMRPVISPGQQRAAGSHIRFDPANTLLMSLLSEEIRRRGVRKMADVSPATLRRMGEIYAAIEPATPNDPATGRFRQLIAAARFTPLIEDAQRVLSQVVRVAGLRTQLKGSAGSGPPAGDELMELYVRQAALAARQVRRDNGPSAMLLALATAVNDPKEMARIPIAATLQRKLESPAQQAARMATLGEPTMRGRVDLGRHFFTSAELTALAGSDFARGAGLAKELSDSRGGSGFSFRDLAADEAGIRFAEALLGGRLSLDEVAQRFTVAGFMPPVDGLREGMQAEEFAKDFGGAGDRRYTDEIVKTRALVDALPGYAPPAPTTPATAK
jgi:hypothetical protein